MAHGRIRRFGGGLRITLRDRATLRNRATGNSIDALAASGDHAIGAESLALTAPFLAGSLPAGVVLSIGGQSYTTTNQVDAAAGVLSAIAITPPLVAALDDAGAVTVATPYADAVYDAMRSSADEKDAAAGLPDTARVYRLSAHTQTRKPKKGDILIDGDGKETVISVREPSPAGDALFWVVVVGSAA